MNRARSPLSLPGQFLQDSGGLEGILQEAAKGVYKRSEKWGLSQALRGAVQGLQSGNASPRRQLSSMRGSLLDGKAVQADAHATEKVAALEERNTALGKLLQEAMDDLSQQVAKLEQDKAETAANALTLTVAKLQYIQVYLDNSTLPIGSDNFSKSVEEMSAVIQAPADVPPPPAKPSPPISSPTLPDSPNATHSGFETAPASIYQPPSREPTETVSAPRPPAIITAPKVKRAVDRPLKSPFHHPRPSLAQSSFSWMLGEDHTKQGFVSASPFTPERERKVATTRGRTGFLFGDDKPESTHSGGNKGKKDDKEDDDGFITLGTLKGIPKG